MLLRVLKLLPSRLCPSWKISKFSNLNEQNEADAKVLIAFFFLFKQNIIFHRIKNLSAPIAGDISALCHSVWFQATTDDVSMFYVFPGAFETQ